LPRAGLATTTTAESDCRFRKNAFSYGTNRFTPLAPPPRASRRRRWDVQLRVQAENHGRDSNPARSTRRFARRPTGGASGVSLRRGAVLKGPSARSNQSIKKKGRRSRGCPFNKCKTTAETRKLARESVGYSTREKLMGKHRPHSHGVEGK